MFNQRHTQTRHNSTKHQPWLTANRNDICIRWSLQRCGNKRKKETSCSTDHASSWLVCSSTSRMHQICICVFGACLNKTKTQSYAREKLHETKQFRAIQIQNRDEHRFHQNCLNYSASKQHNSTSHSCSYGQSCFKTKEAYIFVFHQYLVNVNLPIRKAHSRGQIQGRLNASRRFRENKIKTVDTSKSREQIVTYKCTFSKQAGNHS